MHTKATQVGAHILSDKRQEKTLKNTKKKEEKESIVKDKTKNFTSGSTSENTAQIEKELEELETLLNAKGEVEPITGIKLDSEIALSDVEAVLQKILDSEWTEEEITDISSPIYMLELEKESELFYSVNQRTFVPVKNHIEVIPVKNPFDNNSDSFFYVINNEVFDIDDEKVICVGWN